MGVGVRLGGDAEGDGTENEVYGNILRGNIGGGIRVQREPQRLVCDNQFVGNGNKPMTGTFGKLYGGGGSCDTELVTDLSSVTGSSVTSTLVTSPGAGPPFPVWPDDAVRTVSTMPTTTAVQLPELSPADASDAPDQTPDTSSGYKIFSCPSMKAGCIVGMFRPGEGLLVLQSTDTTLVGTTIGFADVLVDGQQAMVNPAELEGRVVGIEFDRVGGGGLVAPILSFVVDADPETQKPH